MAHNDFGFSLSENSVNEINSLIEQYSQDIVFIMNGFQDDLIEHISTANYDKLLKAVDGIIELYNNSVRYDLKTTILDKWQEACESMSSFAERMDMGEESEQVASEIEELLASVFEVEIENRLHEVDIDGRTSASIVDFDSVNEIFDSVVKKVQELSDEFSEEAERLGEDNEFYKFIIPVVIAYSSGICSYFRDATKNLESLEDNYISKMAEKRDAVHESRQDVDLSSLLDFSDLTYAGMGSISQNAPSEKRDVSPVADSTGINGEGDKTPNKYEKLIKALSKFDGNECAYPELRRKYDEHLDKYKKGLDTRVKAEYDKRDKQLKQYHTQLEQQLKNRHKELDGRYIKGTISLQQAEYMYAESCAKADQLYSIKQRTLWAEYQNICQQANQIYKGEVARCNQIADKTLQNQQSICRKLYEHKQDYILRLKSDNAEICVEELHQIVSEINYKCPNKCKACVTIIEALDLCLALNDDGIISDLKRELNPLNVNLKEFKRRKDNMTWEANLAAVNRNNWIASRNNGDDKYTCNCQRCVVTYEARCRGFDVTARERLTDANGKKIKEELPSLYSGIDNNGNRIVNPNGWASVFRDKNGKIPEPQKPNGITVAEQVADIEKKMARYGNGARAIIRIQRFDQLLTGIGGHVFIAEQINGKTVFCDPQSGTPDAKYHNFGNFQNVIGCIRRSCNPNCPGKMNNSLCEKCYPPANNTMYTGIFINPREIRFLRIDNLLMTNKVNECTN